MSGSSVSNTKRTHVVVSGGSRGLCRALVEGLIEAGHQVSTFIRGRTDFIDEHSDEPGFYHESADVCQTESLARFLKNAKERFGPPYGLVNCAGVATVSVLSLLRDEQIDHAIATNLRGTLILTRLVVRQRRLSDEGGSIVNITSVVGVRGYRGMAVYAATKGGIDAMSRALGAWQFRINSIAPGYLRTEMSESLEGEILDKILRRTRLGRLVVSDDVVGPVKFLLSDVSKFVTGQVLIVDGGISA